MTNPRALSFKTSVDVASFLTVYGNALAIYSRPYLDQTPSPPSPRVEARLTMLGISTTLFLLLVNLVFTFVKLRVKREPLTRLDIVFSLSFLPVLGFWLFY